MTVSQKEIILQQLIKSDRSFNLRHERAQIYVKELKNVKNFAFTLWRNKRLELS